MTKQQQVDDEGLRNPQNRFTQKGKAIPINRNGLSYNELFYYPPLLTRAYSIDGLPLSPLFIIAVNFNL